MKRAKTKANTSQTQSRNPVAAPETVTTPEPSKYGAWWDEDPRREQALELIFRGTTKRQTSITLGVHRNTINNWCDNPEFQKVLAALHGDRVESLRARRAQQTNAFADRIAVLTDRTLTRVEQLEKTLPATAVVPVAERSAMRDMVAMFRDLRAEERIDTGDNALKHNHNHSVTGGIVHAHASVRATSFKDYLREKLTAKVIDVDAFEASNQEPIVALVERLLTDTPILDEMIEDDKRSGGES